MTFFILLQHGKSLLLRSNFNALPHYFTLDHYLVYLWLFIKADILVPHNKQIRIIIDKSKNALYRRMTQRKNLSITFLPFYRIKYR